MKLNDWKRTLRNLGYPELPRAERRPPSGLAAMYGSASAPKLGHIKDISSTGIYLQTEERWRIGEVISMTLQREAPSECLSQLQINVQARVATHGEDGVGLAFVLPTDLDSTLWEALVDHADAQPETEHIAYLFRLVRTILFLSRLCPSGAQEAIQSLGNELDASRTRSAMKIALRAEELLAEQPDAGLMHAHPRIVASILREASWSNDDLLNQLWAGLLASTCAVEETDESYHAFAELLVQISAAQARIFVAGCRRAREMMSELEKAPSGQIIITPEEMTKITGTSDFFRNAAEISSLFHLGLLEKVVNLTSYIPKDTINITPSHLGLELYGRCRGHALSGSRNSL
ncbi:MAG TPA: PilZ domain-containing protein [Terracidiphilus sp.]|nr:PilZ domain-containing protein [Terracidiphilus sp.]